MNNATYSEVLTDCLIKLGEALQVFSDALKEWWEDIKEFVNQYKDDDYIYLDDKPNWIVPKNIVMKSQVNYRRPALFRARSTC